MFSKKHTEILTSSMWIAVGAVLVGIGWGPRVVPAVTVGDLVAQAKQEGALNATVTGQMKGVTIAKLAAAYKKRFELNIKVTIAPTGDTRYYPKAIAATRAGGIPTYDSLEGSLFNQNLLIGVGGVQRVEGWEGLVAEMNPLVRSGKVSPTQISPRPLSGLVFHYMSRVKAILYNPRVISKDKLPRTHAELGDPKYNDRFVQPPFPSHWNLGLLAFPDMSKEKWLDVVRKAGKNTGAIGFPNGNVQRILTGEYAFGLVQIDNYVKIKDKDPKAPLGYAYFKDYNAAPPAFYIVRRRARHPAAGTLFALWIGTPAAKAIWQSDLYGTQFKYGQSELDKKVRGYFQESGATVITFMGSDKGIELLKWFGTADGKNYSRGITQAIRGN